MEEVPERRARARTTSKPARYLDAPDEEEPPPKRQKDMPKEVRVSPPSPDPHSSISSDPRTGATSAVSFSVLLVFVFLFQRRVVPRLSTTLQRFDVTLNPKP